MAERENRMPTVLFVDDEEDICQSLARALREFGYETTATTDPHEALALAEGTDFDLAVIDLVMPSMEGIDLVKRLLRVDPRLRCLILTAYGAVESCNRAYQAGIVRYLQKPVSVKILHQIFNELLEQSRTSLVPLPELARVVEDAATVGLDGGNPVQGIEVPEPADPNDLSLDAFRRSAIRRYLLNASRLCRGCPKSIALKAGISIPTVYRMLNEYDIPFDRKGKRKD